MPAAAHARPACHHEAPMLLHGHAKSRRSYGSWLWSPHVVLESPCHRCACRRPLSSRGVPLRALEVPTARAQLMATLPM